MKHNENEISQIKELVRDMGVDAKVSSIRCAQGLTPRHDPGAQRGGRYAGRHWVYERISNFLNFAR